MIKYIISFTLFLSLISSSFGQSCTLDQSIEVISTSMGSPLEGPFLSGEEIEFKFTLITFTSTGNNCAWLQGIVPDFGDG